ncbi:MAG: hypothetical protein Q8O35_01795 [Humidesulfovibrio sp.]|uniref:hypothetical protein n=1 Tax=Humidesulfovibrio sp. TaxID=2910988 RepID=UPI0027349030|nr:hypothetical protein [Humidesulfovibrio sp.]MDP2846906.1 hypothetical protein [Humidesulfovibrio sp.]
MLDNEPVSFDFGVPCFSYNVMEAGVCWPPTAGYEHVVDYFANGVGFLETDAADVGRGLLLMFEGRHGCCALNDGQTIYWGMWDDDVLHVDLDVMIIPHSGPWKIACMCGDTPIGIFRPQVSPEYMKPVETPVQETARAYVPVQRCYLKPVPEVVFDVVTSTDDLKDFPEYDLVAQFIRPGVRYKYVTGRRSGLMLRFWGEHACFVELGMHVRWGQWHASENWLRYFVGRYISAADGGSYDGESVLDRSTGLFMADTIDPHPYFTEAIPTFDMAPDLWEGMRRDFAPNS